LSLPTFVTAMADYYSIIAKAVSALDPNNESERWRLYERAGSAVIAEMNGADPAFEQYDIAAAQLSLEMAIDQVEADAARGQYGQVAIDTLSDVSLRIRVLVAPSPPTNQNGEARGSLSRLWAGILRRAGDGAQGPGKARSGHPPDEIQFEKVRDTWLTDLLARASREVDNEEQDFAPKRALTRNAYSPLPLGIAAHHRQTAHFDPEKLLRQSVPALSDYWPSRCSTDLSIFDQITSELTVKSICSPMGPDIPAGSNVEDLNSFFTDAGRDPLNYPSRVIDSNGKVTGIIWFERLFSAAGAPVEEVMEGLDHNHLMSSATTIIDAVELFSSNSNMYFYITHLSEVVGVIFYRDLFKPQGRLAFLALALQIEDQALRLCDSASIRERCWLSLSDYRRRKAIELFKLSHGREPRLKVDLREDIGHAPIKPRRAPDTSDISLLIGCTNLVDKATMIWKQKLITPATKAEVLGCFNDLKEVRDQCAQLGVEKDVVLQARLAPLISSAKRLRNSLCESTRSHEIGEGNATFELPSHPNHRRDASSVQHVPRIQAATPASIPSGPRMGCGDARA
jgi:hypothetical protein